MAESDPEATTTHLADRYPQIDTPLRVEPPANMKAPHRVDTPSRDAQIRRSAYSPRAYVTRRTLLDKIGESPGDAERLLEPGATKNVAEELPEQSALGPFKTEVSNYTMLAFSSQRAGKREMEAQAYFAIGVLHDNVGQYGTALESYGSFLDVARKMQDRVAEGLAYNSMGVDCMLSACPPSPSGGFGANQLGEGAVAHLRRAIEFHDAHLKVADEGGRFMASTNLGLCYGAIGDALASARHLQNALRIAISLQSFSGQSISVGNLGSLAMRQGDYATARPCMEQHLQLVQSLQDQGAEIHAYMQLGHLAMADKDYETALKSFVEAANIAESLQELGTLKRANCYVGIAKGSLTMSDMFNGLIDTIRATDKAKKEPKAPKIVSDDVSATLGALLA